MDSPLRGREMNIHSLHCSAGYLQSFSKNPKTLPATDWWIFGGESNWTSQSACLLEKIESDMHTERTLNHSFRGSPAMKSLKLFISSFFQFSHHARKIKFLLLFQQLLETHSFFLKICCCDHSTNFLDTTIFSHLLHIASLRKHHCERDERDEWHTFFNAVENLKKQQVVAMDGNNSRRWLA